MIKRNDQSIKCPRKSVEIFKMLAAVGAAWPKTEDRSDEGKKMLSTVKRLNGSMPQISACVR